MAQTILISGCSSGIGYYCAHQLHQQGFRVIATARKEKDVERLRTEGLISYPLDLASSASIQQALELIFEQHGRRIDVLFNNGAYGQPGATEDLSREVMRKQFETNVFGTMELTNRIIPLMRQQQHGRIIHNSSVLGFVALAYRGAYNASKYALEGFADTQRLELKGSGVYISLIEPGPITSSFRQNAYQHFLQHIDRKNSAHADRYHKMEAHFTKQGPAVPFTLGPEAVYKALQHAIQARRPKERYYVTFPTRLFGVLKRVLTTRAMDKILAKV